MKNVRTCHSVGSKRNDWINNEEIKHRWTVKNQTWQFCRKTVDVRSYRGLANFFAADSTKSKQLRTPP